METSENIVPAIRTWLGSLARKVPTHQDDALTQEAQVMQGAIQHTVTDILWDHWLRSVSVELEKSFWTQRWLVLHILVEDTDDKDMLSVRKKLEEWVQQFDPESRIRAIKIWPMNARHMAGALMAAESVRDKRQRISRPVSSSLLPQT